MGRFHPLTRPELLEQRQGNAGVHGHGIMCPLQEKGQEPQTRANGLPLTHGISHHLPQAFPGPLEALVVLLGQLGKSELARIPSTRGTHENLILSGGITCWVLHTGQVNVCCTWVWAKDHRERFVSLPHVLHTVGGSGDSFFIPFQRGNPTRSSQVILTGGLLVKLYLAGPMRGIPEFNFPMFKHVAAQLRAVGHEVFNPAERDEQIHGPNVSKSPTGSLTDIVQTGFSLREALGADLDWICTHADGIALLPGWEHSKGAQAEKAVAEALGLQVLYINED